MIPTKTYLNKIGTAEEAKYSTKLKANFFLSSIRLSLNDQKLFRVNVTKVAKKAAHAALVLG